jgi:DNA-binding NarL/FixJ family response regulator
MIKILLVEDHNILREGLKCILDEVPGFRVVDEARNGKEVLDKLGKIAIDVILLDINMPVMGGLETMQYINEHHKEIKVLVLSMLDHDKYLYQMFQAGATGYLLKYANKDELIYALKKVAQGGIYICSDLALVLLDKSNEKKPDINVAHPSISFSKREVEILSNISEGHTSKNIANMLSMPIRTVETLRMNLIEKTKTKNTASLVKFAYLKGIIKN